MLKYVRVKPTYVLVVPLLESRMGQQFKKTRKECVAVGPVIYSFTLQIISQCLLLAFCFLGTK